MYLREVQKGGMCTRLGLFSTMSASFTDITSLILLPCDIYCLQLPWHSDATVGSAPKGRGLKIRQMKIFDIKKMMHLIPAESMIFSVSSKWQTSTQNRSFLVIIIAMFSKQILLNSNIVSMYFLCMYVSAY